MSDVRYTKTHEWVRVEGDEAVIGITDYAQTQLGDVVYVELPEPGRRLDKDKEVGVVESVKAASEIFAPLSGAVTAVNGSLAADPARVNTDAEGEGWFFRMKLADATELDDLLDADGYKKFVEGLG
jgi:glycine cleavage system H protein